MGITLPHLQPAARLRSCKKLPELFPASRFSLRCYPHPARSGGIRAKFDTLARPYSYMFSTELQADLARHLETDFDILHLEQLWCGWLGLRHSTKALVNVHHLEMIDLAQLSGWRGRMALNRCLMFRSEKHLIRRFKWFRSCSARLVPHISRINPLASISTVPVGDWTLICTLSSQIKRANQSACYNTCDRIDELVSGRLRGQAAPCPALSVNQKKDSSRARRDCGLVGALSPQRIPRPPGSRDSRRCSRHHSILSSSRGVCVCSRSVVAE